MFKDIRNYIILGLSFVVIIFILRGCARPSEQNEADRKKQYDSAISELKARADRVQELQEHAIKSLADHRVKDSIQRAAFEIENTRLKKQLATRRPQVQVTIDSTPPLKAFIETQDSIILTQDVRIGSLEASLQFHAKVNQDLIAQENIEDKIEQQMALDYTRRIAELEKLSRKKERKTRLKTILIPVALIGGFLLGSQL